MSKEVKLSPRMRAILEAADCDTGWEVPKDDWENFPWQEYNSEIEIIHKRINSELGLKLEENRSVQDASFCGELYILGDTVSSEGMSVRGMQIGIIFSNFGKLYTIWSSEPLYREKFDVESIKRIIDYFGWQFVPNEELGATYDGKHDQLRGKISWMDRFFSYV